MNASARITRYGVLALCFGSQISRVASEEGGPLWRWKESTPGVKLEIRENYRTKKSGTLRIGYSLLSAGFPQGHRYLFYLWTFGKADGWLMMSGFSADAAGRLTCDEPIPPAVAAKGDRRCPYDLEKLETVFTPKGKGIPFQAAILSEDGDVKAFARAVPLPIDFTQGGCRLSAEPISEDLGDYLIQGEGYTPGEVVNWTARTQGLSQENQTKASETGKFVVELHPGVSGADGGKVEFTATGVKCNPALLFHWGK